MAPSQITRRTMMIQTGGALALAGCKRIADGGTAQQNKSSYRLGVIYFAPEEGADTCLNGIWDGLKEQGFERGRNLEVLTARAQAEIANIPMLLQNYMTQGVDLIMTLTTPCLTAASSLARNSKVVFTYLL